MSMISALQKIADNYGGCHCDHTGADCCEKVGEFCPHCIAEIALAAQAQPLQATSGGGVASHAAMKNMTEIRPGVWQSEKPMGTVDAARLTEIARSITRTLASTGDTPQPQDEMCECGSAKSKHTPFMRKDESQGWYCPESPISSRIRTFKLAALGKTPDAREWLYKNGWAESEGCWWHPATDEYGVREIDLPAVLIAYQVFLATPDAREEKEK